MEHDRNVRKQHLGFNRRNHKGQARIRVIILIALASAITLFAYLWPKKSAQTPASIPVSSAIVEKHAAQEPKNVAKPVKIDSGLDRGGPLAQGKPEPSAFQLPQDAQKRPILSGNATAPCLSADKNEVSVAVDEGQRSSAAFKLTNTGTQPISVTLYKSELDQTRQDADAQMEKLVGYKNSASFDGQENQGMAQASVFAGSPWVMLFPTSVTLDPSQSKTIQLTVDARTMSSDEHTAYVYALGTQPGNALLLPIEIKVTQAPKLALARIQVDDGFSAGTSGNRDTIANPAEIVKVTAFLENRGNAPAQGLTLEVSSSDRAASILENRTLQIPSLASGAQYPVRILLKVSADADPVFPPALYLKMTDSVGRSWQESFSVGDPGKVRYPLGAAVEKEQDNN